MGVAHASKGESVFTELMRNVGLESLIRDAHTHTHTYNIHRGARARWLFHPLQSYTHTHTHERSAAVYIYLYRLYFVGFIRTGFQGLRGEKGKEEKVCAREIRVGARASRLCVRRMYKYQNPRGRPARQRADRVHGFLSFSFAQPADRPTDPPRTTKVHEHL